MRLENLSRLHTGLLLLEDQVPWQLGRPQRFVVDQLVGGSRRDVRYELRAPLRGRYDVGPLHVQLVDPFGLCRMTRRFAVSDSLTVVPNVVPLPPVPLQGDWSGLGESRNRSVASTGEDDVVPRQYRTGDELRRVHWKSTARSGELMVRQEEQPWRTRATVLLDTRAVAHRGDGPASSFEWSVTVAASVSCHLSQRGYALRLLDLDGEPLRGDTHIPVDGLPPMDAEAPTLDALAVVRTTDRTVPALADARTRDGARDGLVVAVLADIEPALAELLGGLRRGRATAIAVIADVSPVAGAPRDARGRGPPDPQRRRAAHRRVAGRRLRPRGRPRDGLARCGARARLPGGPPEARMTTVSDTHARPATDGSSGPGPTDPAGATPTQQRETSRWLPTLTAAGAVALSSLSLSPLLGDGGWLGWPLLALVAITVTGGLLSGPRTPPLLVPVVQAAVGLAVLVLAFVPDAPWGLVPSPDALGELRQALQDGLADVNQFAPPVPITTGLLALLTLGVGVCALATHVLAVTLRMPVLAGAPLAAMYAVPASVLPDGAPWWSFVFVVLGWLAILLADSRLQVGAWGRVVPRGRDATTRIGSTAWTGPALRLGSLAVLLALVIPPLVPGLTDAVLGGHGEGGTSAGGDADPDAISLDPFVSLRRDLLQARDVEVFAYDTPTDQPAYLRTVVADSFDGERWIPISYSPDKSLALADATVRPPGLGPDVAATPVPYQFTSVRLSTPYLPLPYPVASVFAEGDWHWDTDSGVAFSTTDSTARTTWQVSALDVEPTVSQLEAVRTPVNDTRDRVGNTLQTRIPDSLTAQAREVTAGLTTPYAQALALQWWFRDEFTYSTEVRGDPSADQLTEFLKDRIGYCQQFAATMALMARSLEHPGPGRRRVHARHTGSGRALARQHARCARLAGAVLQRCGVGPLRADAPCRERRRRRGGAALGPRRRAAADPRQRHSVPRTRAERGSHGTRRLGRR